MNRSTGKYLREIAQRYVPIYRVRSWLFSVLFGLSVIATSFFLHAVIPNDYDYSGELITFLFILISVLILFPARDIVARRFLKRQDYLEVTGQDVHHLDFLARQFDMDTLINEIFPELMDWLQVGAGKLVILDPERNYYLSHTIRNGRVFQDQFLRSSELEECRKDLIEHRSSFYYDSSAVPHPIRDLMNRYHSRVIQPFVFRNRLLGFLLLNEVPRNRHQSIALETFAGKAAASIQNYILSMKVIDARIFERELFTARKIQKLLQVAKIPSIPGYSISDHRRDTFPCVTEFFKSGANRHILIVLCTPRPTGASGIIMFGMLGYLYSYLKRIKAVSISRLRNHLRKDQALERSSYRIDILLAEINTAKHTLKVMIDGKDLRVECAGEVVESLIPGSPKNIINLSEALPVKIKYSSEYLLEINSTTPGNPSDTSTKTGSSRTIPSDDSRALSHSG